MALSNEYLGRLESLIDRKRLVEGLTFFPVCLISGIHSSALIKFRGGADETNFLCQLVRFTDLYIGCAGAEFS